MKESFLIYKSFYEPIKSMSNENLGALFRSIFEYQLEKKHCNNADVKMAFDFFVNQFRLDDEKYQKTCEARKMAGSEGGKKRVANQANATFAKQSQANQAVNVNDTVNVNVNDNVNVNVIKGDARGTDKSSPIPPKLKTTKFVKPSTEEITAYCHERNNNVDANKFYDYYESNGWHVGKNPMKDWKAAIRTWERKENYGTGNANSTNGTTAGTSWGEAI